MSMNILCEHEHEHKINIKIKNIIKQEMNVKMEMCLLYQ
jgi:hypothetical protein